MQQRKRCMAITLKERWHPDGCIGIYDPVLEYCAPVFHHALPAYLCDELERVQKRALSIILSNGMSCHDRLSLCNLETLEDRGIELCKIFFWFNYVWTMSQGKPSFSRPKRTSLSIGSLSTMSSVQNRCQKKSQMFVYRGHALSYTKLVHRHATQTEGNKYFIWT